MIELGPIQPLLDDGEVKEIFVNGLITGRLKAAGIRPKCAAKFEESGIQLPSDLFLS